MNIKNLDSLHIIEFDPKYEYKVKKLIFTVVSELGFPPHPTPTHRYKDLDHIEKRYRGRSRFWIAIINDKVIGTVAIKKVDTHACRLRRMFVLPEFHGKGIGDKLLSTVLSFARENNYEVIHLKTHKYMTRAHRFYEKHGFKKIQESKNELYYELDISKKSQLRDIDIPIIL